MHSVTEGWNVSKEKANKCKQTNTQHKITISCLQCWSEPIFTFTFSGFGHTIYCSTAAFLVSTISGWLSVFEEINFANITTHPLLQRPTDTDWVPTTQRPWFTKGLRLQNGCTLDNTQKSWSNNTSLLKIASFITLSFSVGFPWWIW